MATITLGGRVLEVRPATLGMLKHEMPRWHAKALRKTPLFSAPCVWWQWLPPLCPG